VTEYIHEGSAGEFVLNCAAEAVSGYCNFGHVEDVAGRRTSRKNEPVE
jgi:hypothetical protein